MAGQVPATRVQLKTTQRNIGREAREMHDGELDYFHHLRKERCLKEERCP